MNDKFFDPTIATKIKWNKKNIWNVDQKQWEKIMDEGKRFSSAENPSISHDVFWLQW